LVFLSLELKQIVDKLSGKTAYLREASLLVHAPVTGQRFRNIGALCRRALTGVSE